MVLRGVTNEPLSVGEGNIGWRDVVPLIIDNDLNVIVLADIDTKVHGFEITADS